MIHVEVKVIDRCRHGREIGSLCCKGRLNIGLKQYLSECGPKSYGMALTDLDSRILKTLAKTSCSRRLKDVFGRILDQVSLKDRERFRQTVLDSRRMQITVWR